MKVSAAQVKTILSAWGNASKPHANADVRLAFAISDAASRYAVRAVAAAFVPQTPYGKLYVAGYGEISGIPQVNSLAHAACVMAGSNLIEAESLYRAYVSHGVPCLIMTDARVSAKGALALMNLGVPAQSIQTIQTSDEAVSLLASWFLTTCEAQQDALVLNFDCCREVFANRAVLTTSRDNALIGALQFLGRAETPLMLTNEVVLASKLASLYDRPLEPKRLAEVAGLGGYSLVSKTLSKMLLKALPAPAWLVKPVVAFGATYFCGTVLKAWYASPKSAGAANSHSRRENQASKGMGAAVEEFIQSRVPGAVQAVQNAASVLTSFVLTQGRKHADNS